MKAVAFANNDIAVAAWTFGGRLPGCLGFAIYRIDVNAGTEICLPALATFPNQDATAANRTTAQDPVQKFFWKDVYAKRGGSYRYRIVPMTGTPGTLVPMPVGALTTNVVQLTPDCGVLSAYFNRGILATQATARALHGDGDLESMKTELLDRIGNETDQLRLDLAGQMIEAMTTLPKEAAAGNGKVWCALYEFEDKQLITTLEALAGNANVILSNMPGKVNGEATKDTYEAEREAAKQAGVYVTDRMMPGGHIGHNKFTVLDIGGPRAVQFGSTNWTDRALCAQSNNSIIARSPRVAAAYTRYWTNLATDTQAGDGEGKQLAALRDADASGPVHVALEDGSGTVDLWFSPTTAHARPKNHAGEATPPDMQAVFDLIAAAKQAILFVVFEPGEPSIIDAIAAAQKANPALFVRGTVTVARAAEDFAVGIRNNAQGDHDGTAFDSGQKIPIDYRVIPAEGVNDPVGVWEKELNKAGFAVTHSKYVVIDPFTDGCVVVTGSHNLGFQASYNNDENLAIIRGNRSLAESYAANALDIYDHYAWRWWLAKDPASAWTSLKTDESWQDTYFDAGSNPISPELSFWLAASPAADALPAPSTPQQADRTQPAVQEVMQRQRGNARPPATHPPKARRVQSTVSHADGEERN
ncbi:MAG TPA: phospholipase D-like domain-containing protein [Acetobacteraceae bacterium]|nr:phospholipase D-like domain-containing protein [Acetobacteraceae bacterium]